MIAVAQPEVRKKINIAFVVMAVIALSYGLILRFTPEPMPNQVPAVVETSDPVIPRIEEASQKSPALRASEPD